MCAKLLSFHAFKFVVVKLFVFLGCCVLVLLVLRDQVVHVALGFGELELIHAFSCVPVQECFASEHRSELFADPLEH